MPVESEEGLKKLAPQRVGHSRSVQKAQEEPVGGHCVPAPRAKVRTREFDRHPEKEVEEKVGKSQLEKIIEAGWVAGRTQENKADHSFSKRPAATHTANQWNEPTPGTLSFLVKPAAPRPQCLSDLVPPARVGEVFPAVWART